MAEKLVTIANFDEPYGANIARVKLESEGIKCFLTGENFVATYWLMSFAEHGIKLKVKESDAAGALEVLGANEAGEFEKVDDEELAPEPMGPACPKCGCEEVEYKKFSRVLVFLSILVLRFPIPWLIRKYKCESCGHTWR